MKAKFFRLLSSKRGVNRRQKKIIARALNLLPERIIKFLQKNPIVLIVGNPNDGAFGSCATPKYFKGRAIIVLFPKLWKYGVDRIVQVIFHEIAHLYLKKRGKKDTEREVKKTITKWLKEEKLI